MIGTIFKNLRHGEVLIEGYLGTNFSRASGISFQNREGTETLAHTTSWGVSTRMIGGMIMTVGDRPVAFTFGLDCGTTRYCIANNFDREFSRHSPGRVLLYADFEAAWGRGIERIDWGLGDAGYKEGMGARPDAEMIDVLLVRPAILAALLSPLWMRG